MSDMEEIEKLRQRLISQSDYSIKLARIIEALCHGTPLPTEAVDLFHYKMAAEFRASSAKLPDDGFNSLVW